MLKNNTNTNGSFLDLDLAQLLGFKYPCNEYMATIILLYGEIFLICSLIFLMISMILLSIIETYSRVSSIYTSIDKWPYLSRIDRLSRNQQEFIVENIRISTKPEHFIGAWSGVTYPFIHTLALSEIYYNNPKARLSVDSYFYSKVNTLTQNSIWPRTPTKATESALDLSFLLLPTVIVLYMLIPSLGFLYTNELSFDLDPFFSVFITGHQWYWSYEYHFFSYYFWTLSSTCLFNWTKVAFFFDSTLDLDSVENRLLSVDRRLILPVGVQILLYVTSTDVIHSWALPQFGIKIDAIPGRLSSVAFNSYATGIFYGQCSELCGVNHGFMPIVVEFVSLDIFIRFIYYSITFMR